MSDRTMIKMTALEYCIEFRTVSWQRKSPRRFLILRTDIERLALDGHVITRDIWSFAELRRNTAAGTVSIEFSWLSSEGNNGLRGCRETVNLPYDALMDFARCDYCEDAPRKWACLDVDTRKRPRLVFHDREKLRSCLACKAVRKKLIRYLRDHFNYPNADEIIFSHDFAPYSFFFRGIRYGGAGIAGGLILHNCDDLEKAYYATHT